MAASLLRRVGIGTEKPARMKTSWGLAVRGSGGTDTGKTITVIQSLLDVFLACTKDAISKVKEFATNLFLLYTNKSFTPQFV